MTSPMYLEEKRLHNGMIATVYGIGLGPQNAGIRSHLQIPEGYRRFGFGISVPMFDTPSIFRVLSQV